MTRRAAGGRVLKRKAGGAAAGGAYRTIMPPGASGRGGDDASECEQGRGGSRMEHGWFAGQYRRGRWVVIPHDRIEYRPRRPPFAGSSIWSRPSFTARATPGGATGGDAFRPAREVPARWWLSLSCTEASAYGREQMHGGT